MRPAVKTPVETEDVQPIKLVSSCAEMASYSVALIFLCVRVKQSSLTRAKRERLREGGEVINGNGKLMRTPAARSPVFRRVAAVKDC